MAQIRRGATFALMVVASAAFMGGCDTDNKRAEQDQATATPVVSVLTTANAEFAAGNYGRAAQLAAELVAKNPLDPQAHLLQARAEARLGNAGNATRALEQARRTGALDLANMLRSPDFDLIRDDPAFSRLAERVSGETGSLPTGVRRQPEDTLRAGDVSISETASSETIRAGDVVLEVSK